jgi:ABC-2 type transport system permease protein
MFGLMMRLRLLSGRNMARDMWRRSPVLSVAVLLLGAALFGAVYVGFLLFFGIAERMHILGETAYQVFYFLFLFLLAGAVPFVSATLLQASDYALLYSSPLPPRAIVAAKLLDATVVNSLQFAILGVPAIVACATAVGLPLWAWIIVPLLVMLFVLMPALLTALALLIALGVMGMRRLRGAITLVNAVTGAIVCLTIVTEIGHQGLGRHGFGQALTGQQVAGLMEPSPVAHVTPSAWFATLLLALSVGNVGGMARPGIEILVAVGGLFAACIALGGRLLSAANVAEENEGGTFQDTEVGGRLWRRLFPAPVVGLMRKDFKYLRRDSVLPAQLGMPLILFCIPFVLATQNRQFRNIEELYPITVMMTGVILFMQTSILSLSSIGIEGRAFWILRTGPNSGATMLSAKFWMSTLFCGGVGTVLTLLTGVMLRLPILMTLIQLALVLFCSAGLCGLGVGLSAALPRFVYENPAHRVSAWALILGFFTTIGYLLLTGVIFGVAYLIVTQSEFASPVLVFSIASLLFLTLTVVAIFVPLGIGARRLERFPWEH